MAITLTWVLLVQAISFGVSEGVQQRYLFGSFRSTSVCFGDVMTPEVVLRFQPEDALLWQRSKCCDLLDDYNCLYCTTNIVWTIASAVCVYMCVYESAGVVASCACLVLLNVGVWHCEAAFVRTTFPQDTALVRTVLESCAQTSVMFDAAADMASQHLAR